MLWRVGRGCITKALFNRYKGHLHYSCAHLGQYLALLSSSICFPQMAKVTSTRLRKNFCLTTPSRMRSRLLLVKTNSGTGQLLHNLRCQ